MTSEWTDKFNPYNSDKLFAQIYKWEQIKRGQQIPAPTTVSIDLANLCDLACEFCNANYILNKNHKVLSKSIIKEIAVSLSKWGVETICCFTGDTKVKLVNGKDISFEDLEKVWKDNNKPFEVYSRDENGKIVSGVASNPRIIKKVDEIIEIVLDNGEKIRCTPDHFFMVKSLSKNDFRIKYFNGLPFIKAKDLIKTDSLVPLHTFINRRGYEEIKDTTYGGATHKLFAMFHKPKKFFLLNNTSIHHKDTNKLNNTKDNLAIYSRGQHSRLHAQMNKNKFGINRDKWNNSIKGKNWIKNLGNPETKIGKRKIKRLIKYNKSKIGKENSKKVIEKFNSSPKGKANSLKQIKIWNNSEEGKKKKLERLQKINESGIQIKNNKNSEFILLRRKGKVFRIFNEILKRNLELSKNNYVTVREIYSKGCFPKLQTVDKIFGSFNDASKEFKKSYYFNHKISNKKIIKLKKSVKVYCLSVKKFHNFALSSGVFVKNCGGGGESLLNKNVGYFIDSCIEKNIDVGVVTNGTQIDKYLNSLSKCSWVGISVDAGTKETYLKIKRVDKFNEVFSNIKNLVDYSIKNKSLLTDKNKGVGVGIKFLVTPENINDIYKCSKLAKDSGCTNIHIRPVAPAFDNLENNNYNFNKEHVDIFKSEIEKARELEDNSFRVFGITHKFGEKFNVTHPFKKCHAPLMTCVIMPPSGKGNFDVGFCCDRRGDDSLTLRNLKSIKELIDFWGSNEHWDIVDKIKLSECPRCLPKGSEVMTKDGLKKIEDIDIGDLVLTKEGTFKKVVKTFINRFSGDLVKIENVGGDNSIMLTKNHKLPIITIPNCNVQSHNKRNQKCISGCYNLPKEKRKSWGEICKKFKIINKDSNEINFNDDFLLIPKFKQDINIPVNPKLMRLIGYYLSEGTLIKNSKRKNSYSICFYFSEKEIDYHKEIKLLAKELFNRNTWKPYNRNGSTTVGFSLRKEDYLLFKQFGCGAHSKKFPSWVFDLNKDAKKELLIGYFNGDGCFNPNVSVSSVSKQLLEMTRLLLTEFNIISSIYKSNRSNGGVINGRLIKYKGNSYNLVISNSNKNIFNLLNLKTKKVVIKKNQNSYVDIGDYWISKVKSRQKEKYVGDVYNLEVEDSHTYVTGGVVVNNCTYSPHNQIYENAILKNKLSHKFI